MKSGLAFFWALLLAGCVSQSEGLVTLTHAGEDEYVAKNVLERTNSVIKKINAYWGEGFNSSVRVNIEDRKIRSSANYTNRFINLSLRAAKSRRPVIEHEVAHIIAGCDASGRRFLNEGIAMYLEQKFHPDAEYRSIDLDEKAERAMMRTGFISLQDTNEFFLDSAERLKAERFTVYREAGSFVRYLIEMHGLKQFKEVYRGFSFESVYGVTIDEIQSQWLDVKFPKLGGRKYRTDLNKP
ncbi:MAG: hypothetical protein HOO19_19915 [Rhodospirillaceae bacterium]|jgi:hypothetical protein|nr:hypothetical protein [Rhodospirillaceae bacterium]MBT3886770.1 hypothetical protein [Rhodospirillaceae bacterium]MBT4116441.1 hypothetical protein [Rhodospirillaceae bacterium]MBT4670849.1 hypothetical protein [Rhodospirillaceae bacterium]MBT4717880.1 hypothetical protein [Rhodospirillaceae bacterium]